MCLKPICFNFIEPVKDTFKRMPEIRFASHATAQDREPCLTKALWLWRVWGRVYQYYVARVVARVLGLAYPGLRIVPKYQVSL